MYKIVDYFNGWEDDRRFECFEHGREILEEMRVEFYDIPENQKVKFNKVVVPANYIWCWDKKKKKFFWG